APRAAGTHSSCRPSQSAVVSYCSSDLRYATVGHALRGAKLRGSGDWTVNCIVAKHFVLRVRDPASFAGRSARPPSRKQLAANPARREQKEAPGVNRGPYHLRTLSCRSDSAPQGADNRDAALHVVHHIFSNP